MTSINKSKLVCASYTVLWMVYYLQGALRLDAYGAPLLFTLIAYSLYKVVYVLLKYRLDQFMRALTCMLVLFTIYGIIYMSGSKQYVMYSGDTVSTYYYLKYIYCSIPIVYVYYDFTRKGVFDKKAIFRYIVFFVITAIYAFFSFYARVAEVNGSFVYVDGLTNNAGYRFVAIIPLLFLCSQWRFLFLCICVLFPVLSLKRGAIIIAGLGALMLYRFYLKTSHGGKNIRYVLFGCIGAIGVYWGLSHFISSSSGFQKRIEMTQEGNVSGRDKLAYILWNHFLNETDEAIVLLGNGADATVGIAGNYAHNDWLEILTNQGVLGVILYFAFFISWYCSWRKLKKRVPLEYSYSYSFTLLYFFMCSIFSMAYTAFFPSVAIAISLCLHNYKYKTTWVYA